MPRQILLADDSATIARMVQIAFAHEDYQVTVAKGADEALAKARASRPDVVLADAGLPGKTGYDLCAELRSSGLEDVAVLVLTNNFVPYDDQRGQRAGADGAVVKPFETQGLIDKVTQAIAQKSGGAAAPRPPVLSTRTPASVVAAKTPAVGSPAVTVPAVSLTPASTPAVRLSSAPTPAPIAPSPPPAAPVAATPPPRGPESSPRLAPRATLMGLPTVGPDGLPIPIGTPPPPAMPTPAAPIPGVRPPAAGPVAEPPPPVIAVAGRPAPSPFIPSPNDLVTRPAIEAVRPPVLTPAAVPAVPPTPPPPRTLTPAHVVAAAPAVAAPVAAPPPPPPPAPVLASIPASAPKMPRASLVPNAPPPEALRRIVEAVAGAAQAQLGQNLGAHPEYEAIARLSREVIEKIAWEVVPELAEVMIRAQLDKLVKERQQN